MSRLGDMTGHGDLQAYAEFNRILGELNYEEVFVIAGDADTEFMEDVGGHLDPRPLLTNATYLEDSSVTRMGYKIYGSPWVPDFFGAFNVPKGVEAIRKWKAIPTDTDILLTHTPPYREHLFHSCSVPYILRYHGP